MRSITTRTLLAILVAATALAGCAANDAGGAGDVGSPPAPGTSGGDAERAIEEADIVQLDGGRLYAMSESGTVSVVDVSEPGRLALLGQATLPGSPFEMYLRDGYLVTMSNRAVSPSGALAYGPQATDPDSGALVLAVDVRDPARISMGATLDVPGEIADSRVVGNVLYLATYENTACFQCGPKPRTLVTSFNIRDPLAIRRVDQLSFESNAPDGYNLPWGSSWKRSIHVTPERLYIGGHADIDPDVLEAGTEKEGIIDVVDVSDPSGRLGSGARITVAGAILSRWQIDERDGILRVVSQRGAGRTGNGLADPEIATFRIESTRKLVPLGLSTLHLPRQEGLRSVRFDGDRAYAITYNQTDPLLVIDLSNPRQPVQRGELQMPGFVYHLEPFDDRVLGLGIDRDDPEGSLNVSLFDVSDLDAPRMIERVGFGEPFVWEDYQILNGEMAEDQDRIQKAFRVLPGGLVVAPFSSLTGSGCGDGGGVQLVEWTDDTLIKRALLPVPGNPRRALLHDDELLAVSDSNVRSFSLAGLDAAEETADLVIGDCVPRGSGYGGAGNGGYYDGEYANAACSAAGGGPGGLGDLALPFLAMAALFWRRRRVG